jgi:hypothetical protein
MDATEEQKKADNRRKLYEQVLADYKSVVTWADFYAAMKKKYDTYMKCHCPFCASAAIVAFYGFIKTLEAEPDEGDIQKLVERYARLLAYESEAKLGMDLKYIDPEEIARLRNTAGLAAVLLGAQGMHPVADEASEEVAAESAPPSLPAGDKGKLH